MAYQISGRTVCSPGGPLPCTCAKNRGNFLQVVTHNWISTSLRLCMDWGIVIGDPSNWLIISMD